MIHPSQPVFDQSLPMLDVALLAFCIFLLVWTTSALIDLRDLRERTRRFRAGTAHSIEHSAGGFQ